MVLCAGKTVRRTIFCPEPPRTKTLHEGCGCYILSGVRGFVLYSKYLFKIRKKRLLLEHGGINHSESSRNNQSELIRNSQCTCLADRLPTVIQRDR